MRVASTGELLAWPHGEHEMTRKFLTATALWLCAGCGASSNKITGEKRVSATDSVSSEAVVVSPSPAQVEYYSRAMLMGIAESLSRGGNPTRVFGRHPALWYVAARRSTSGSAEVHDRWIDVTFVQAGKATLMSGGTLSGSHLESPGEHRGGTINGGSTRQLAAGDFFVIPAGVPHQYELTRGDSLVYLTVKVLSQATAR